MDGTDEKTLAATPGASPEPLAPESAAPASSTAHSLRSEIRVWTRDLLIAIGLALVIIVFLYSR